MGECQERLCQRGTGLLNQGGDLEKGILGQRIAPGMVQLGCRRLGGGRKKEMSLKEPTKLQRPLSVRKSLEFFMSFVLTSLHLMQICKRLLRIQIHVF